MRSLRFDRAMLTVKSCVAMLCIQNRPFMVTEFMALGSLRGVLADTAHRPLTWTVRVRIATDVAEGMAYLHETGAAQETRSVHCSVSVICDL